MVLLYIRRKTEPRSDHMIGNMPQFKAVNWDNFSMPDYLFTKLLSHVSLAQFY